MESLDFWLGDPLENAKSVGVEEDGRVTLRSPLGKKFDF